MWPQRSAPLACSSRSARPRNCLNEGEGRKKIRLKNLPLELTKKREEWKKERKKRKGKELRVHKCILQKEEKTKY